MKQHNNRSYSKKDKAKKQVAELVSDRFDGMHGIVYCAKCQDRVQVAHQLKEEGITVTYVHGTLSDT
jgi:superfamily II DNA helicase RecQ